MTSVLEKLKALDAQRVQLLEGAKKEALDNAKKAVAELNELGFHYSLTEGASVSTSPPRAPRKAASQAPKRQARDLPCPICKWTPPKTSGRIGVGLIQSVMRAQWERGHGRSVAPGLFDLEAIGWRNCRPRGTVWSACRRWLISRCSARRSKPPFRAPIDRRAAGRPSIMC